MKDQNTIWARKRGLICILCLVFALTSSWLLLQALTYPIPALASTSKVPDTSPDLMITGTATLESIRPGALLTYTFIVNNLGDAAATGVVLTDTLPAGVSFVSVQSSRGFCHESNGVVICSSENLLSNPGAETGSLSGWTIGFNGGMGWGTISNTEETPHSGVSSFITSYDWDTRSQEIDLLAAGFPAAYLDSIPPVEVGEWFRGRGCNGVCNPADPDYIKVELRNGLHAPLASWNVGSLASPAIGTDNWTEQAHAFSGYGTGLRYLYFEDGGRDA